MKKIPLISVIMATYNRAHLLPRAIESILNQTFTDFEFIIIDDGSEDSTQDVLQNYQKQDSRMVICQQPNSGLAAARNHGLRLAQGKYIALMDDDDFSMPKRLERQLAYLENSPSEMGCVPVYHKVNEQKQIRYRGNQDARPLEKSSHRLTIPCTLILSSISLLRKDTILACNGWRNFSYGEDLDFTLRFQEKFSAGLVKENLYQQKISNKQITMSSSNLVKNLSCHILAYTSAWYRRHKGYDPLAGQKYINENLAIKLLHPLPQQTKAAAFHSAAYMLKEINTAISRKEIKQLFTIMMLCDPTPRLVRKVKRKILWRLIQQENWQDIPALWRIKSPIL